MHSGRLNGGKGLILESMLSFLEAPRAAPLEISYFSQLAPFGGWTRCKFFWRAKVNITHKTLSPGPGPTAPSRAGPGVKIRVRPTRPNFSGKSFYSFWNWAVGPAENLARSQLFSEVKF